MPQGPTPLALFAQDPSGVSIPVQVDAEGNLITTASGSGDAVSIADGADVTQGAKADAAWVSGAGSVVALLKAIAGLLAGILSVKPSGASAYNNPANTAGHQIKTGAGVFQGISVNTAGLTSTATLYDGTSTSGTKLGTFSTLAVASLQLNIAFTTGLFVVLAGGTAADVT